MSKKALPLKRLLPRVKSRENKSDFPEIYRFVFFSFSGVSAGFSGSRPLQEGGGHPGESFPSIVVQNGPHEFEIWSKTRNRVNEHSINEC